MFKLHLDSKDIQKQDIYSACSSSKIKMMCDLASNNKTVAYIGNYDKDCYKLQEQAKFFSPNLKVVVFPAWDCIAYDRVSPSHEISGARISALNEIRNNNGEQGLLIITSIKAVSRILPSEEELFNNNTLTLSLGDVISASDLEDNLLKISYGKNGTVREYGQYSIKGSIIDIYPTAYDRPVRLKITDGKIEAICKFNPESQISEEQINSFQCLPTSEIILNSKTAINFVGNYKQEFEASTNDAIFKAISEKRKLAGMEHWLPFFYEKTCSFFDYCTDCILGFDEDYSQLFKSRESEIHDLYKSRLDMLEIDPDTAYKPVPMERAFINKDTLEGSLNNNSTYIFHNFKAPATIKENFDAGFTLIPMFNKQQNPYDDLQERLDDLTDKKVIIACYSRGSLKRIQSILEDHDIRKSKEIKTLKQAKNSIVALAVIPIEKGFQDDKLYIISEQDLLGERISRKVKRKIKAENFIQEISTLDIGDLVVHRDHGIGRFEGLEMIEALGTKHDFLKISYRGEDRLFVPVENLELLSVFGEQEANLDKLGGSAWQSRRSKVKKNLLEMADGLMKLAAKRKLKKVEKLEVNFGEYQEFCSKFPYDETEDQLRVIDEAIEDMQSGTAMDRLVCGDVGFGKTEIAIRAAFAMAKSGKQVAIIAPTTLLVRQHYQNLKQRFRNFDLNVERLSRMITPAHANKVKASLTNGEVDIVIGTHALFSDSVKFKDLGLLIVDEEQHFGVKQKEKIKAMKEDVHVLTLTATPIPRTLQLSLTGVRDLSLITTPPVDRIAVRTSILPYDSVIIKEALLKEHYRGGQSFFVCPRIKDIPKIQKRLDTIVPELSYITATGQLSGKDLDEKMTAFSDGQADILLATNIIESGIDIPTANTMVIHRSDMFGLSQLYQLRGRVGRSKARGYSYFTYPEDKIITEKAQKRLEVIETLDSLGAGFQLASYDLDIRGAGNLLGEQQSGHIKEVGMELYQDMLKEAVEQVKAGGEATNIHTDNPVHIDIGLSVLISADYVDDISLRMSLYKRVSNLSTRQELNQFAVEMIDRFGDIPREFKNLLETVELKQLAKLCGVERIEAGPNGGEITFYEDGIKDVDKLLFHVMNNPLLSIKPDNKVDIIGSGWADEQKRINAMKKVLELFI